MELACGKAAKRTKGFGAQSMTNPELFKFIMFEGTHAAAQALRDLGSKPASRGQMCVILHSFRKGRELIAQGEGQGGLRINSPVRRRSPSRSPVRSSSSSNSSPEMNNKKLLNVVAFTAGLKKRRIKRILTAMRPKKNAHLMKKREHMFGPVILMGRPQQRASSSSSNFNVRNRAVSNKSNGSRSGSGSGSRSKGGSGSGSGSRSNWGNYSVSNENKFNTSHYMHLNSKFNKVPSKKGKKKATSRFSTREMFPIMKPSQKVKRVRARMVKKKYPLMVVPRVAGGMMGSIPTRPGVPFHMAGSRSPATKLKIAKAHNERMRQYAKLMKPNMSKTEKAALSNRLMQRAIKNVMGSNSEGESPNKKRAKNVKVRIMKKLAMKRKLPQVDIAKAFAKGITSALQQVNAVTAQRQTKEERNALKKLMARYADKMKKVSNNNSSSSSSSGSPVRAVAAKPKKSASGALKSIRKK